MDEFKTAKIFVDSTCTGTTVYTACFAGCTKEFATLADANNWLSQCCRLFGVARLKTYVIDTITCTEHNRLLL